MNLDWLASVETSVELGPVGEGAARTPAFLGYQALLDDRAALRAHEDALVAIVRAKDAKPAAIIYAAYLLKELGRADLRDLLAPYDDDRRECSIWPGGCEGSAYWLCEATRSILGETWSHPVRLLSISIEQIERAKWLELPGDETMRATREGRRIDGRLHAVWVLRFAEMWNMPRAQLEPGRDLLEALRPLVARVYAAMLLDQLDALAATNASIDVLERGTFGKRTRSIPLREAIALCREWSARYR